MLKSIIETNIQIPIGLSIKKKPIGLFCNLRFYSLVSLDSLVKHGIPNSSKASHLLFHTYFH